MRSGATANVINDRSRPDNAPHTDLDALPTMDRGAASWRTTTTPPLVVKPDQLIKRRRGQAGLVGKPLDRGGVKEWIRARAWGAGRKIRRSRARHRHARSLYLSSPSSRTSSRTNGEWGSDHKEIALENFDDNIVLTFALAMEQVTTKKEASLIRNVDGCIAACFVDRLRGCGEFTMVRFHRSLPRSKAPDAGTVSPSLDDISHLNDVGIKGPKHQLLRLRQRSDGVQSTT